MDLIKHFSFDLWLTLIKSNPNFKKERAMYFFKNFNTKKKKILEIEIIFRHIDLMCNSINEKTGRNIGSEEMYSLVLYEINDGTEILNKIDLQDLYSELEELFFNYPPEIFDEFTIEALETVKEMPDTTMNILSNTAFIKGSSLRLLLDELGISRYFDFQIYSDEEGFSKPNPSIFKKLLEEVNCVRNGVPIQPNQIIHVGDNVKADYNGAISFGFNSKLINSNGLTIKSIYEP